MKLERCFSFNPSICALGRLKIGASVCKDGAAKRSGMKIHGENHDTWSWHCARWKCGLEITSRTKSV